MAAHPVFNFRSPESQRAQISNAATSLKISDSAFCRDAINSYLRDLERQKLISTIDRNAIAR
jgi:hypothetical protein